MIAHNVFFSLKDNSNEAKEKLIASCKELLTGHEGTRFFGVGTLERSLDREVNDRHFDVALHLVFESIEAHDQYQDHPRHLQFINANKETWSQVRVFDSNVEG